MRSEYFFDYDDWTLWDYQQWVESVAIYPEHFGVMYTVTGLAGEAGELAGKVGKVYRDKNGDFSPEDVQDIKKELGDVLWMIGGICNEFNIDMQEVMELNVRKIEDRKARGKITGSGDNR